MQLLKTTTIAAAVGIGLASAALAEPSGDSAPPKHQPMNHQMMHGQAMMGGQAKMGAMNGAMIKDPEIRQAMMQMMQGCSRMMDGMSSMHEVPQEPKG